MENDSRRLFLAHRVPEKVVYYRSPSPTRSVQHQSESSEIAAAASSRLRPDLAARLGGYSNNTEQSVYYPPSSHLHEESVVKTSKSATNSQKGAGSSCESSEPNQHAHQDHHQHSINK